MEYCRENDVNLVAYSPLARGRALDLPEIRGIAEERDATPAQVCLAWLIGKEGVAPIPKATPRGHIEENYAALELELEPEDVERIEGVGGERRLISPLDSHRGRPHASMRCTRSRLKDTVTCSLESMSSRWYAWSGISIWTLAPPSSTTSIRWVPPRSTRSETEPS